MKGEYVEEENDINNNNTQNNAPNMFAKFSHHPKFHPPPPPPHHHHHHHHHFPPPHLHHSHHPFSEESDSATTTTPTPHHQHQTLHESITKKPKIVTPQAQTTTTTTSNEDGGTIEVSRRPRGRPPGSKNKPKPPVVITREPDPAMSPYILELPSGADVIDSLTRFTRRRGVGLCVLTASGAVANVTLKQPSTTTPGGTVTFHGRFDILSLSAVVVNTVPFHGGAGVGGGGFTISLAGPQGQIVGGKVVGTLACSGTVYVIAASFNNPTYCRLPLDEQEAPNSQCHGQGNDEDNSAVSGGGDGGGTMSLYSGHLGNTPTTSAPAGDVIWATPTTARPTY